MGTRIEGEGRVVELFLLRDEVEAGAILEKFAGGEAVGGEPVVEDGGEDLWVGEGVFEGLHEEAGTAGVPGAADVVLGAGVGEYDDGDGSGEGLVAEDFDETDAVDFGEVEVQDDEVGEEGFRAVEVEEGVEAIFEFGDLGIGGLLLDAGESLFALLRVGIDQYDGSHRN